MGISNTSTPVRETQVSIQINTLRKDITNLTETVDRLEDRLGSIVTPQQANTLSGMTKAPSELCSLAGTLRESNDRIEDLVFRLSSLIERIEL